MYIRELILKYYTKKDKLEKELELVKDTIEILEKEYLKKHPKS